MAVDILNKNVLRGGGGLSFADTASARLISEVTRGFDILGAEPYAKIWAEWRDQSANLMRLAIDCDAMRLKYKAVRSAQGKIAAADLSKKFMAANRAVRSETDAVEDAAEKIDQRFKKLLGAEKTAIEKFIGAYVEKHPDEFFLQMA